MTQCNSRREFIKLTETDLPTTVYCQYWSRAHSTISNTKPRTAPRSGKNHRAFKRLCASTSTTCQQHCRLTAVLNRLPSLAACLSKHGLSLSFKHRHFPDTASAGPPHSTPFAGAGRSFSNSHHREYSFDLHRRIRFRLCHRRMLPAHRARGTLRRARILQRLSAGRSHRRRRRGHSEHNRDPCTTRVPDSLRGLCGHAWDPGCEVGRPLLYSTALVCRVSGADCALILISLVSSWLEPTLCRCECILAGRPCT